MNLHMVSCKQFSQECGISLLTAVAVNQKWLGTMLLRSQVGEFLVICIIRRAPFFFQSIDLESAMRIVSLA
jgi:hypothetical protein